jgi:glycosyltransferase involved in cell wall biosynthesis
LQHLIVVPHKDPALAISAAGNKSNRGTRASGKTNTAKPVNTGTLMTRVLFLIRAHEVASSRVRVLNLLPELHARGLQTRVVEHPNSWRERLGLLPECRRADVVVIQKTLMSPLFLRLLRLASRRLVYDFDDAVYHSSKNTPSRSRMRKFATTVRQVELVIAGNDELAKQARQFNRNIVVLPSAVETRGVPTRDSSCNGDRTIIGWVGGRYTLPHLLQAAPVLARLAARYPIELRILSSEDIDMPGVNTRFIPWQLETQNAEIAQFDIGIMPLPDTPHTRGKCGYKALQYMAAAVVPVVSNVGTNAQVFKNGEEGLAINNDEEMLQALATLIEDPELRRTMGLHARCRVEQDYAVEVIGSRLAGIIQRQLSQDKNTVQ